MALTAPTAGGGPHRNCLLAYRRVPDMALTQGTVYARIRCFQAAVDFCTLNEERLSNSSSLQPVHLTDLALCIYLHYPRPGRRNALAKAIGVVVIPGRGGIPEMPSQDYGMTAHGGNVITKVVKFEIGAADGVDLNLPATGQLSVHCIAVLSATEKSLPASRIGG